MKLFETVAEMEQVPRVRRPKDIHTKDQIVAQAARLGWTVGITASDLVGQQCGAVIGLHEQDEAWLSGTHMAGVWYETVEDAGAHQRAMSVVPHGRFQAMVVSPLVAGRLDPPDICLIYATPDQMIMLISGLQWAGYRKLEFGVVGESSCSDSWGRGLATGEPSLSIPCFAERRYGGVLDDELLIALPPAYLPKVIGGMQSLSANGLRYPTRSTESRAMPAPVSGRAIRTASPGSSPESSEDRAYTCARADSHGRDADCLLVACVEQVVDREIETHLAPDPDIAPKVEAHIVVELHLAGRNRFVKSRSNPDGGQSEVDPLVRSPLEVAARAPAWASAQVVARVLDTQGDRGGSPAICPSDAQPRSALRYIATTAAPPRPRLCWRASLAPSTWRLSASPRSCQLSSAHWA
jgi:uncharacterized protein (DUF169 family)